jgi:hypothetical protein
MVRRFSTIEVRETVRLRSTMDATAQSFLWGAFDQKNIRGPHRRP